MDYIYKRDPEIYGERKKILYRRGYTTVYSCNLDYVIKNSPLFDTNILEEISITIYAKDHPNIIGVEDVFTTLEITQDYDRTKIIGNNPPKPHKLFINMVMDKAKLDLFNYNLLQQKDITTIKIICYQISRALYHLKRIGVCHRDVKPSNVLLFGDFILGYRVKLADFGLACYHPKDAYIITMGYTEWYRSPEIWLCQGYSYSADVWALGCTIYETYTGKPLFKDLELKTYPSVTIDNIIKSDNFLSNIDDNDLKDLLLKIFTNKTERINIEDVLLHPWFHIIKSKVDVTLPVTTKYKEKPGWLVAMENRDQSLFLKPTKTTKEWRKCVLGYIEKHSYGDKSFALACVLMDIVTSQLAKNNKSQHRLYWTIKLHTPDIFELSKSCCILASVIYGSITSISKVTKDAIDYVLECCDYKIDLITREDWMNFFYDIKHPKYNFGKCMWKLDLIYEYSERDIADTAMYFLDPNRVDKRYVCKRLIIKTINSICTASPITMPLLSDIIEIN